MERQTAGISMLAVTKQDNHVMKTCQGLAIAILSLFASKQSDTVKQVN